MKFLIKQIDIKNSEKIKLENDVEKVISDIKEFEQNITISTKSVFERIIEIMTLSLINYKEKYLNIINENERKIFTQVLN